MLDVNLVEDTTFNMAAVLGAATWLGLWLSTVVWPRSTDFLQRPDWPIVLSQNHHALIPYVFKVCSSLWDSPWNGALFPTSCLGMGWE